MSAARHLSVVSEDSIHANITTVVKIQMALHKMNQRDLAEAMGVNESQVTRSFKGERKWQIDDLDKLGKVFDKPLGYFLEKAGDLVRSRCTTLDDQPPFPPLAVHQLALDDIA